MAKLSHFRSTWPTAHLMVLAAFLTFAPVADAITYTIRNYPLSQTRDGDSWTLFGSIITDGTLGTFTPEWDPVVEGWTTSHITGVSITISRPGESFSSSTEPVWLNGTINATAGRLTMGSGNFGMQGPGPVASGIRLYYSQSGADYEGCYAGSSNNWITAWATSTSDNTLGTGPGSITQNNPWVIARTAPNFKQFAGATSPPPVPTTFADGSAIVGDWGDDTTLNSPSGNKMRKTGCVVTDIAMLLNWFGHNITPGELNGYLSDITGRTPGSYLFNDGSFHDAYFPASGTYGQSDGVQGLPVRFRTQNIAGATNQAIIDQLQQTITRNGPVLLTVPSESSGPTTYPAVAHSILAYAVVGQSGSEKILIRDPGHVYASETPSSDLTLDDYVNYENNKFPANPLDPNHTYTWLSQGGRIKYAELVNTSTTPMGSMVGHSPIDFVITDPLGHRLGYDPVTGISYNEIPGSFYGRSQKEAAAEGFNEAPISGYSSIDAEMGQLSAGQYAVQVYGLDSGAWSIDLGVSDPNNIFSFGTNILGGVASAGSYELFTVTATAVPEPSAFALLGVGAVSLLGCAWRRRS